MYDNDYDNDYYDYEGHTGDPHRDMEYERRAIVPSVVLDFIGDFCDQIQKKNVHEIQNLYENIWPKLSEQYYDKYSWPDMDDVEKLLQLDSLFKVLYKELYFRHIHARIPGGPEVKQRMMSYFNYCQFFNAIITSPTGINLELPDIWLWELIDEFIYQYQSYSQYRARLTDKSEEQLMELNTVDPTVWNILCMLNVLHSLVDMSNIKKQLEVTAAGGDPDTVAGEFGKHPTNKMLGYFSLVGLLRVHTLLGDYYSAIKILEPIEVNKKTRFTHIPACQISTSYYVGFSYMMMRRYSDAIRTFSSILLYVQRTSQLYNARSYQNDQINKQTDQMFHLLAICLVLHPQCIDESLQQILREKSYHENMYKMQYGDKDVFRTFYLFACPKFLPPLQPPPYSPIKDFAKETFDQQIGVFMEEVDQQLQLPTIRSYLKLYTTLPVEKLATFMDKKKDDRQIANLLVQLLCFKHKMKNIVWTKGSSLLDGQFQSGSELDFYIDNEMIHIADTKVSHRYGDFFIRKIMKFEELNRRLHQFKI